MHSPLERANSPTAAHLIRLFHAASHCRFPRGGAERRGVAFTALRGELLCELVVELGACRAVAAARLLVCGGLGGGGGDTSDAFKLVGVGDRDGIKSPVDSGSPLRLGSVLR